MISPLDGDRAEGLARELRAAQRRVEETDAAAGAARAARDALMLEAADRGLSQRQIGAAIGTSGSAVNQRLKALRKDQR